MDDDGWAVALSEDPQSEFGWQVYLRLGAAMVPIPMWFDAQESGSAYVRSCLLGLRLRSGAGSASVTPGSPSDG